MSIGSLKKVVKAAVSAQGLIPVRYSYFRHWQVSDKKESLNLAAAAWILIGKSELDHLRWYQSLLPKEGGTLQGLNPP